MFKRCFEFLRDNVVSLIGFLLFLLSACYAFRHIIKYPIRFLKASLGLAFGLGLFLSCLGIIGKLTKRREMQALACLLFLICIYLTVIICFVLGLMQTKDEHTSGGLFMPASLTLMVCVMGYLDCRKNGPDDTAFAVWLLLCATFFAVFSISIAFCI